MSTTPKEAPIPQVPLEPTGVPQLDLVLGGGIPRGSLAVILGPPGSGKTTLASQIAFAAAQRGQQALLLTALSEPTTKLLEFLSAYRFYSPDLIGSSVQVFSLQQFLSQGEATTAQEIVAAVRQTKANIVVLDGFQGLRGAEADFTATRQLLYDLGTRLSLRGTTTLITTESDPRDSKLFPEMTTGDVLIGLHFTLNGARAFRGLEAIKVRGREPLSGRHNITLNEEGVHVFPRLETRVKHGGLEGWPAYTASTPVDSRATFDLPELDELLGGGLTRHTSTLLTGSLGVGKTFLALQFVLAGLRSDESALYLGFRETAHQLIQKVAPFDLGAQLYAALNAGKLLLQRWEPIELDPDQVAMSLLDALDESGAKRMVIDSVAELERAVRECCGAERSSNYLAALLTALRRRGVTLLAIKETPKGLATHLDFSADTLSLLAENVLLLEQVAYRAKLHRVLSVLKMRFSAHDYALREFLIAPPEGIRVLSPGESGLELLGGLSGYQGGSEEGSPPPAEG